VGVLNMEALAIIFVFVVAVAIYVSARVAGLNPAGRNRTEELALLESHRASLLQTARRGRAEGWDSVMLEQVDYKLSEIERRIATAGGFSGRP
jgi:hypothetical protein